MAASDLVVVYRFGSRAEADLAISALSAAGIEAMVVADSVGNQYAAAGWATFGFSVLVRTEDADAARDILERPARPE